LWHGIVRPYKGISFLLKAWKRALAAGANAVLVILGTGDRKMLSAIGDEVSSLGIASSVRLLFRFVSVDELATFFEAADVLIYPYSSEVTTSGALMTGIAYGKAIVASSQPAFEEILSHEDNALLVRYGDIEALATAIARLAGNAGLRAQLAARLRARHVNSPTWVDIARRTSECYRALLSSTPSLTESLNSYTI
jgi:glycosyltransferase involved in cell wall biosynthesis